MKRELFLNQVTEKFDQFGIPYTLGQDTDIKVDARFEKEDNEKENEAGALLLLLLLFFNPNDNTVYAYERALLNDKDLAETGEYYSTKILTHNGQSMFIGGILGAAASIANSLGLNFVKTKEENIALYPPAYIPPMGKLPAQPETDTQQKKFCVHCGAQMNLDERFCSSCGADEQAAIPVMQQPSQYIPPLEEFPAQYETKEKKKFPIAIIIGAVILISLVAAVLLILGRGKERPKKPTDASLVPAISNTHTPDDKDNSKDDNNKEDNNKDDDSNNISSVVSEGVSTSDLGNIVNSQFYFRDSEHVVYSSMDLDGVTHIYYNNVEGDDFKIIFDGFGWSMFIDNGWLYFCGNEGATIDGTYNIYRINLDSGTVQNINSNYSTSLFKYKDWLYYLQDGEYYGYYDLYRSNMDGSGAQKVREFVNNPVIYKDKLYYIDTSSNLIRTNPDGTEVEVLYFGITDFVIGNDKIIYKEYSNNIGIADFEFKDVVILHYALQEDIITALNSYGDKVFFAEIGEFSYSSYAYEFLIRSIDMNTLEVNEIYESMSYGTYINAVDNRLYVYEYTSELDDSFNIVGENMRIVTMDFYGGNISELSR